MGWAGIGVGGWGLELGDLLLLGLFVLVYLLLFLMDFFF
jgi:hypothetical protein